MSPVRSSASVDVPARGRERRKGAPLCRGDWGRREMLDETVERFEIHVVEAEGAAPQSPILNDIPIESTG